MNTSLTHYRAERCVICLQIMRQFVLLPVLSSLTSDFSSGNTLPARADVKLGLTNMLNFQVEMLNLYRVKNGRWHQTVFIPNYANFAESETKHLVRNTFKYHVSRYAEGKSKFSEYVLNEGHELKTIEETMSIIHLENNHIKLNTL